MAKIANRIILFILLTALTQLGGLAYVATLGVARVLRLGSVLARLSLFLALYIGVTHAATFIAPHFGRVALSCFAKPADHLVVRSPSTVSSTGTMSRPACCGWPKGWRTTCIPVSLARSLLPWIPTFRSSTGFRYCRIFPMPMAGSWTSPSTIATARIASSMASRGRRSAILPSSNRIQRTSSLAPGVMTG